jgi:hypothetical protein
VSALALAAAVSQGVSLAVAPGARADVVAYQVNVTVRPGYNFVNADDAIGYGQTICDKVGAGRAYVSLIGDLKADFSTADDYQAAYLINQAVNELCPALIWQLRNSAAGYVAPAEPWIAGERSPIAMTVDEQNRRC